MIDRRYLFAYLRSRDFQEQLDARKGETDMVDYASLTTQKELEILLPPIDDQREIGRLIGALDHKIELNRETSRTLEAMAAAIFRSWFVDFDPVVAKAAGRPPFGMDAATAGALPRLLCRQPTRDNPGRVVRRNCGQPRSRRERPQLHEGGHWNRRYGHPHR